MLFYSEAEAENAPSVEANMDERSEETVKAKPKKTKAWGRCHWFLYVFFCCFSLIGWQHMSLKTTWMFFFCAGLIQRISVGATSNLLPPPPSTQSTEVCAAWQKIWCLNLSKNQFCKEKEKKRKQRKECWLCDAKQLLWVSCKSMQAIFLACNQASGNTEKNENADADLSSWLDGSMHGWMDWLEIAWGRSPGSVPHCHRYRHRQSSSSSSSSSSKHFKASSGSPFNEMRFTRTT